MREFSETFHVVKLTVFLFLCFVQNQFVYRDGAYTTQESVTLPYRPAACPIPEVPTVQGATAEVFEDTCCNGTLRKQNTERASEESSLQRYSADPTAFVRERNPRGVVGEDGYMTPIKEKPKTGGSPALNCCIIKRL